MENEKLKTKLPPSQDNNSGNTSLHTFDLPALIDKMKHELSWANGELSAMILLKSPNKQIVLTALHQGTKIKFSASNDYITFHIIKGKLKFHIRKEFVTLEKGQMMTLHENINYNLNIKEETVLLLTIANTILQPAKN